MVHISTMDKLARIHFEVGNFLYDVTDCQSNNTTLWDFYDCYHAYVAKMIAGECSLAATLAFDLDTVDNHLTDIEVALAKAIADYN